MNCVQLRMLTLLTTPQPIEVQRTFSPADNADAKPDGDIITKQPFIQGVIHEQYSPYR